jgi:hypothetical protein
MFDSRVIYLEKLGPKLRAVRALCKYAQLHLSKAFSQSKAKIILSSSVSSR